MLLNLFLVDFVPVIDEQTKYARRFFCIVNKLFVLRWIIRKNITLKYFDRWVWGPSFIMSKSIRQLFVKSICPINGNVKNVQVDQT